MKCDMKPFFYHLYTIISICYSRTPSNVGVYPKHDINITLLGTLTFFLRFKNVKIMFPSYWVLSIKGGTPENRKSPP